VLPSTSPASGDAGKKTKKKNFEQEVGFGWWFGKTAGIKVVVRERRAINTREYD